MKILSFDIGLKNLAYCVCDLSKCVLKNGMLNVYQIQAIWMN